VRYSTTVKLNHDHININVVESDIRGQITQFDINPIVYVRFGRPLKEKANLPMVDDDEQEEAGFDYDKYNKLSKLEKIEKRPDSVIDEIRLSTPE
jgi:hypothetical protein